MSTTVRAKQYELTFWGAATVRAYRIPRHRRMHRDEEGAISEALRVLSRVACRAAHPAIIYGPMGYERTIA